MTRILKERQRLFRDRAAFDQAFVNGPADEEWQGESAFITNINLSVRSVMKFVDALGQLESIDPGGLPEVELPAQVVEG